jgi:ribosomal protein S18 acetylase RimI-like enzyme
MTARETDNGSDITIETLQPAQWAEYKDLRLRALQREPQAFGTPYSKDVAHPDEKWIERLEAVGKGTSWNLFARNSEGKLVGMIGGYRDGNDMQNGTAQIFGVYIDQEERGKGIAKKLMNAIISELEKVPEINKIVLEVNCDQQTATKLYEAFGFKSEGDPYPYVLGDGIEHQVVKMVRPVVR